MTASFSTLACAALLAYSAQVLVVIAAAGIAARLFPLAAPQGRLVFFRLVLALCLTLPMLATPSTGEGVSVVFGAATAVAGTAIPTAPAPMPSWPSSVVLTVVAAGIALHLGRLALGGFRLRRVRARSTPAVLGDDIDALRRAVAPHADLRWTQDLQQPAAFGLLRPIVLLPDAVRHLSPAAQRSVVCHELAHVARRDWLWIVAEAHVRALLWFHPAVHWLLDQIHLSREQVVDRFVVTRVGARKAYMHAMLTLSDAMPPVAPAMGFLRRRHLVARLEGLSQEESPMTRRRLLATAGILAVVLLTATRGVTAVMPVTLPLVGDQAGAARLELRLAELTPAPGLTETLVEGSGQRIYLHADVVASTVDVIGARVADAGNGRYSISTEFSAAASARLTTATQAHLGRPVAILLDGRVLAAPVVRSPIGRSAVLTGDFTKERAEAIAAGLIAGRTVAATATPAATSASSAVQQNAAVDAVSADDPSVVLPEATSKTIPVYPLAAQDARIQGIVELSAVVMPDGTVQDITVTESLDTEYGLDQSAMEALSLWRFKPGTKDGVIVPVRMTFVMRFTLS